MNYKSILKYFILSSLLIFSIRSKSQDQIEVTLKNTSFAATGDNLPFWFHANQHGKIQASNQFLNISDIYIGQQNQNKDANKIDWNWGGNLVAGLGNENYMQLNQAFLGITYRGWELKGGMYHDPLLYAGLSSTNGNILRSGNTKPYPNIRFSNIVYKPVPFLGSWLKFKFEFDEGLLDDDRYVDKAHLHHKSLFFLIKPKQSWDFRFGLEHFVMWGGTSSNEDIGQFPMEINDYIRVIMGLPGGKDSPLHDQFNKSGNQLGTYQFEFTKQLSNLNMSISLSHPFENHPGLEWRNWPDNLIGIHIDLIDKTKFVTDILYELTNTRQQNISDSLYIFDKESQTWGRQLTETYFFHGIYQSGFTYEERVIGSPLFFPVTDEINESGTERYGVRSNRFISHHIGLKGNLSEHIKWKGLMTYTHHLGTYDEPYDFAHKQLSGLLELIYTNSNFPVEIGLACGLDSGNSIETNTGVQLSFIKRW